MDRAGWTILVAVALGSAAGGVARHLMTEAIGRLSGPEFPWGTIAVNVSGSLAIGVLAALAGSAAAGAWPIVWQSAVFTGVLGGFTTFSAFSAQTVALLQQGHVVAAASNVALSAGLGVAACWAGFSMAAAVAR
jgi:CrcB protein